MVSSVRIPFRKRFFIELVLIFAAVEMSLMGAFLLFELPAHVAIIIDPILLALVCGPIVMNRVRHQQVLLGQREQLISRLDALRETIDNHTLFSITDRKGVIVDVNNGFCRISGYSRDELIGKTHRLLNSGYHHKEFWKQMWDTIKAGQVWRAEVCNRAKDGSLYWVDSTNLPQFDDEGQVTGYISLRIDITHKKLLEERLDMAMRAANIGLWDWDLLSNETYFSDTFYTMLGYAPAELPMNLDTWKHLCDPDDLEPTMAEIQRYISGETPYYISEHRLRKKDGSWLWIRDIGEIVDRDSDGKPTRMVGVHLDIDHLKRFNRALEQIIEVEAKTTLRETCEDICRELAELFGVDFAAVVRLPDAEHSTGAELIGGIQQGECIRDLAYSLAGTPCEVAVKQRFTEYTNDVADLFPEDVQLAEMNACSYASVRLQDSQGTAIGLLVMIHSKPIPTSYQLEPTLRIFGARASSQIEQLCIQEGLKKAVRETERANRSKSEFLANMSHEIRTPMTAILGYTDLILDPASNALDFTDHAETIKKNATHLMTVINDILDLSKIESGKLHIEQLTTNPIRIIEEVKTLMQPDAQSKGLDYSLDVRPDVPERVVTDPTRFRQIVLNLISNSIKFTETGSVSLVLDYDTQTDQLIVSVSDTGIGMTTEQRERISAFESFSQADGSTARKYGGTGLGLRISSILADLLGGEIQIVSALGVGSTFRLSIDANTALAQKHGTEQVETLSCNGAGKHRILEGCRILLTEDGPDNQRLIKLILRRAGARVTIAENGRHAINAIESRPNQFDLILMDVQMPEMDGYEATSHLRKSGCKLPIIALTAHAMSSDRDRCLQVGCNEYLAKPIDRDKLIGTCHAFITAHKAQRDAA